MFEAGVGVCEGTVLWLEDGVDTFARGGVIEPLEEDAVHEGNDAL